MSPVSYAPSPAARGEQRKFINRTAGWVGVNVFGPDAKPTAIAVEPGGEIWLTPEEERMTAEAPRSAADNPFVREWEEVVETDSFGEPVRTEVRQGVLILAAEDPRPTASSRFIPPRAGEQKPPPATEPEEEVAGSDLPAQPPVQGQPSPDEIVGTPEAVAANEAALAAREPTREQPTRRRRPPDEDEGPLPV